MVEQIKLQSQERRAWASALANSRRFAWIAMVAADVGLLVWGLMAAIAPDQLLGPGSMPILEAGYEGFTGDSWSQLSSTSPDTADFMTLLFRMFGIGNAQFALMAIMIGATAFRRGERWAWWALLVGNTVAYGAPMTYDRIVDAIGPFEALEYVGLAVAYAALALTFPYRAAPQPVTVTA